MNALLAVANGVKTLLIITILILGVSFGFGYLLNYVDSTEIGKQWRVEQRYRMELNEQRYPQPGAIVVIKGKKYTIVRECWLGTNRYELRAEDGSITYATNKEW